MVETSSNAILDGLGTQETSTLLAGARLITLERGGLIADAGKTEPYVYFPLDGVLSLVGATHGGATVEVAVVGNEGMASLSSLLGESFLPFKIVTQVPGKALRVPTELVSQVLNGCGQFHERLLDYTQNLISQVGQSAVCNRFHNARERLARWLLMTADRAQSTQLPLTHEFIAYMVGGPRSAVTEAAAELRQSGAIEYRRGVMTIRSVEALRQQACECYDVLADAAKGAA